MTALTGYEWLAVLKMALPIIILDEVLKCLARTYFEGIFYCAFFHLSKVFQFAFIIQAYSLHLFDPQNLEHDEECFRNFFCEMKISNY